MNSTFDFEDYFLYAKLNEQEQKEFREWYARGGFDAAVAHMRFLRTGSYSAFGPNARRQKYYTSPDGVRLTLEEHRARYKAQQEKEAQEAKLRDEG